MPFNSEAKVTARGRRYHLVATDYESVDVGAAPARFTQAKIDASDGVEVYFSAGPVRIFFHGLDPSATVGIEVFDGGFREFGKTGAGLLRAVRSGPTNGTMMAVYFSARDDA